MRIQALKNVVTELVGSHVVIQLADGKIVPATGFIVRDDEINRATIVIKAAKTPIRTKLKLD